jgi:hypothetical protein
VYMAQHIHHPVAEVHIGSLAAPQQRVHDCSILGSVMVTAKKVILSSLCWQCSYVGIMI